METLHGHPPFKPTTTATIASTISKRWIETERPVERFERVTWRLTDTGKKALAVEMVKHQAALAHSDAAEARERALLTATNQRRAAVQARNAAEQAALALVRLTRSARRRSRTPAPKTRWWMPSRRYRWPTPS